VTLKQKCTMRSNFPEFQEIDLGRPSSSHVQRTTANTDTRYAATLDSLCSSKSCWYQSARPSAMSQAPRPHPGDFQGGKRGEVAREQRRTGALGTHVRVAGAWRASRLRAAFLLTSAVPWPRGFRVYSQGFRIQGIRFLVFAHLRGPWAEGRGAARAPPTPRRSSQQMTKTCQPGSPRSHALAVHLRHGRGRGRISSGRSAASP
jgi:hypothetical protein